MTSDTPAAPAQEHRRRELVEVWQQACADVLALLESLEEPDWARPTALPGWDVKAVASHLAHLESELAGMPQEQVDPGDTAEAPHVRGMMGQYTESGVTARRDRPPARVIEELREAVRRRTESLTQDPPDLEATGPSFAALAGWSWETLLSNRPLDVWMHEQDIREAVSRPGGVDGPVAVHVSRVFARSLPMVVGKRAGAAPGQSVAVRLSDAPASAPQELAVAVGDDGRARPVEAPTDPTASLRLGFADWLRLCGGRCEPAQVHVEVTGDEELAQRVVAGLAVTP
jgi:uncharacterized protein (TIGR03083 family)